MAGRGNKLPRRQVRRLASLHRRGLSQRDVAARVGCTQACVMRWLRRLGLAANGHGTERSRAKKRASYDRLLRDNEVSCLADLAQIGRRIARLHALRRAEGWVERRASVARPSLEGL